VEKKLPERKSLRLKGYDYTRGGYYFITICVKEMRETLGKVVGTTALGRPRVELTPIGQCTAETIDNASRGNVRIEKFVIMPNHIHIIVFLAEVADDRGRSSLQQVVRNIKSFVTKKAGFPLWQPRFHDHIIRNEAEYKRIWQYIDENPARWSEDVYYIEACDKESDSAKYGIN